MNHFPGMIQYNFPDSFSKKKLFVHTNNVGSSFVDFWDTLAKNDGGGGGMTRL